MSQICPKDAPVPLTILKNSASRQLQSFLFLIGGNYAPGTRGFHDSITCSKKTSINLIGCFNGKKLTMANLNTSILDKTSIELISVIGKGFQPILPSQVHILEMVGSRTPIASNIFPRSNMSTRY